MQEKKLYFIKLLRLYQYNKEVIFYGALLWGSVFHKKYFFGVFCGCFNLITKTPPKYCGLLQLCFKVIKNFLKTP